MRIEDIKPRLRRRFQFIEYQLLWEDRVGRKSLKEQFEISLQQATLDLTAYLDFAPQNMTYDPRKRSYVPKDTFNPYFARTDASGYLMHLEMLHREYRTEDEIWPPSIPEYDFIKETARPVSPVVLKTLLKAIRTKRFIEAKYVSLSSDDGGPRVFAPHAIAGDGHRWHMRAYDCQKERFSDFVLSRIETLKLLDEHHIESEADHAWNSSVELRLCPAQSLNERQKRRIAYEYLMQDGEFKACIRKAMLYYYLRYFGFDPNETVDGKMKNKSSFSLEVINLDDVEKWLERR